MLMTCRKEEIFSEASKALKHQQHSDETQFSNAVSGAKKLKTSADVNMPSFPDMMAYIQAKVCVHYSSILSDNVISYVTKYYQFISSQPRYQ